MNDSLPSTKGAAREVLTTQTLAKEELDALINMKKTYYSYLLAVIAVGLLTGGANASVIDLGERDLPSPIPGLAAARAYIEADQGLAPGSLVYLNAFDAKDGFEDNGAVDASHFGATILDGGVNASVAWDLAGSGFQLSYAFLKDGRESRTGLYLYHLYGVTPDEVFSSNGEEFVTINGARYVTYICFFGVPGNPSVPEGGCTLVLLGAALGAIELTRRMLPRQSA